MLFLPDLTIGGAERVVVNLLNHWTPQLRTKWMPTLVLRHHSGGLYDQVPSWVDLVSLNLPRAGLRSSIASLWKLGILMKRRRPQVIVAFHTATFAWVVFASRIGSRGTKIAVSVNNPFSRFYDSASTIRWRLFFKWACKLTDCFWAVTPGIAEELHSSFGIPKVKIAVIPNSVDLDSVLAGPPVSHPAFGQTQVPVIVTAGRLTVQKRLDILLQAASILAARIEFNLVILGDGILKDNLVHLASRLGISCRTFFLGFVPNVWSFIKKASVFALSSDYEGFGNVLIEAMACGVPVVATRAPFGPEYIISNEESGLLIPTGDPEALANGMWRLLVDQNLRQRCIEGGFRRASDFSVEKAVQAVFDALDNLVKEKKD